MISEQEYRALKTARIEGGAISVYDRLGNAHEITTKLATEGLLREIKVPRGTTDPQHTHNYKLTKKGEKELKEMEMTPRSKETLEKRRRTMQLKKKMYA